jgi:hypothetical protein
MGSLCLSSVISDLSLYQFCKLPNGTLLTGRSGGQAETLFIDIPTPGAGEEREEQPQAGNTVTIIDSSKYKKPIL